MTLTRDIRRSPVRLMTQRYRPIFIASLMTLGVSAGLLALISFIQGRGHQALQNDTHTVITQAGQQLVRMLQSRRGALTFLRDALGRQTDLTMPQLRAIGESAVKHTRHLLGIGFMQSGQLPMWWSGPYRLSSSEVLPLNRTIVNRTSRRGTWRAPSTFVTTGPERRLLVMFEPLQNDPARRRILIGVFELSSFLEDFASTGMVSRYPMQILDGEQRVLYRSANWREPRTAPSADDIAETSGMTPPSSIAPPAPRYPMILQEDVQASGHTSPASAKSIPAASDTSPLPLRHTHPSREIIVERTVTTDAARWTIQMQPGSSSVTRTLSWLNVLLIALSLIVALAISSIVWLLAARTWVLQRAVARRTAALRRTSARLRQMAVTDDLTGLYNRRFFLDRWKWEYERAKRYQRPLVCLMVDVNNFKQVNDHLGHHAGDLVLKQVAQELKTMLRQSDILARFGGDEFIVALPETSSAQADSVAEKLRQISIRVPEPGGHELPPISVSVGMGRVTEQDQTPDMTLEAADQSLYQSKRQIKAALSSP